MLSLGLGVTSSLTSVEALVRGLYSAGGVLPRVALDFDDNNYVLNSGPASFSKAFMGTSPKLTYSTTSNSTMVNSSGELVWAPHNLLNYSEDFSNAAWTKQGSTAIDSTLVTGPDGILSGRRLLNFDSETGDRLIEVVSVSNATITGSIWVKGEGVNVGKDITLVVKRSGGAFVADTLDHTLSSEWVRLDCTFTQLPDNTGASLVLKNPDNGNEASEVLIYGAHLYRSDLGGMAQVPGAATGFETYVPTSGNAEYLPRVGHHVYNGSAWVNEGLLIESEPRTNYLLQSSDLTSESWIKGDGVTVSTDGTLLGLPAYEMSSTSANHILYQSVAFNSTDIHTASVFAKAKSLSSVTIRWGVSGNFVDATFDLSSGSVSSILAAGTAVNQTANIQSMGNGVYRLIVSGSGLGSGSTTRMHIMSTDSGTVTLTAPQAEINSSIPSSYMPTSGGTYTRTAQSLEVPPAEFGWPEPEYIGPDLVENGDFILGDNGDWTKGTGWTISGGTATHAAGTPSHITQAQPFELGKVYRATCDVISVSGGTGSLQFRNGGTTTARTISVVDVGTTVSLYYVGEGNNQIAVYAGSGTDLTVDNISVREINPLSVSIQMDGRMTYADEDDGEQLMFLHWYDTFSNYIKLKLQTDSTATGRVYFQQLANGTNDPALIDTYTPGVNVPFSIASRHGSTFIRGAADGVMTNLNDTPKALPDLSGTDLQIAYDFMGTIGQFRQFAGDIGDDGIVEATNPSTEPTLSLTFDGTEGSFYNFNWSE